MSLLRASWTRVLIGAVLCVAPVHAEVTAPEYHVKAAFIYKFATYIRWPAGATPDGNVPFVIGILGDDPFGLILDEVVRGQNVQGRPISIRRLARPDDARACDLVFISSSERRELTGILAAFRGTTVLTVSDIDRFAELGGMIHLLKTGDNHIRFAINKNAIDRAGLKAPSQLLRLARIVDPLPGGEKP